MPEFRFYQLERRRLDAALPDLLEAALGEGRRVVVQTASREACEALNERLWTYREDSFLPHGAAGDGDPAGQPVFLTNADETPNGAPLRVLLAPADAERFVGAAVAQVIVLFKSRDEIATAEARVAWKRLAELGATPTFWKEGDEGGWTKVR